jgi:adhesin/invasin
MGSGQGIVVGVKPDSTQYLNGPANPSPAGDALVIYCAGLGSVDQPVTAGSVSPASPLADTKNVVTVTIEGKAANVFYSGLAPGFAGLYQVNVIVPTGLTPSSNAPLVITVSGQSSPVTTVAVQ